MRRRYDDLAPEEVEELRANPELIHLYDAHRIVELLLSGAEAAQRALDDVRAKVEAVPYRTIGNFAEWDALIAAVLATFPSEPVSTDGETK